jgi:hypothetical protein
MSEKNEDHSNIWQDDILERKEDALYLQNYLVKRYAVKKLEPGFVLAINSDWGYGKSFMLERWKKQILFDGHPVVFFDAWQNDFTEDPLLAFIAEFDTGLKEYFKHIPVGDKTKTAAIALVKQLYKPVLTVLASAAAKHLVGLSAQHVHQLFLPNDGDEIETDSASEEPLSLKDVEEKLNKAIFRALDKHNTIKKSISNFKTKLTLLIDALEKVSGVQLPLIIFVDELDRCRPDYAIELLEGIKHLFGVPGVFFVIATNVHQLGESVKAVYGSGFDGQRYLKRFFDLQYSLREPSNKQFADVLFGKMECPEPNQLVYGLQQAHSSSSQPMVGPTSQEILSFVLEKHVETFQIGLRDQLQIATILEAVLLSLQGKQIHIFFLIFLIVVYQQDPMVYGRIAKSQSLSDQTGFNKLDNNNGRGEIELLSFTDEGKTNINDIKMIEIAHLYFESIKMTRRDHDLRRQSLYDFPYNLFFNLGGKVEGNFFRPDYVNYFDLVQHAGGFSQK